ncbi:pyridoxamine 5'-phosphate oxidase family protein [Microbacterium sp. B2969]|uniref:Pyridoxamine 5'-phosphate oxidase family protein n=1 Tax=Microbacterium alkaliflavum TaxID=3248839 RepID=A0ABW7Q750_9MICO
MTNQREDPPPDFTERLLGRTSVARSDSAVTQLTTAECWRLLEDSRLGRLAVTDSRSAPDLFPVNFTTHEGVIYVRTAQGTKLSRILAHPATALEIDGEDAETQWSVVVRGWAHRVVDGEEFEASGAGVLVSWSPGQKPYAVKITPHTVSGRRFRRSDSPGSSERVRPQADLGGAHPTGDNSATVRRAIDDADAQNSRPRRGSRPEPIPHLRPLGQGRRR